MFSLIHFSLQVLFSVSETLTSLGAIQNALNDNIPFYLKLTLKFHNIQIKNTQKSLDLAGGNLTYFSHEDKKVKLSPADVIKQ